MQINNNFFNFLVYEKTQNSGADNCSDNGPGWSIIILGTIVIYAFVMLLT